MSFNTNKVKLLFVGVWFERKGGRLVLSVFRKLVRKFKNIQLTILGQLPKDIMISKHEPITQKDFISYKELLDHYRSNDILVHIPSEIEGYGVVVPEAMSFGLVPVVSNICALPEFVANNKSGLIVSPGSVGELEEALTRLIESHELRIKLSKGARKRFLSHFSLPVFHRKITKIFTRSTS